MKKKIILLIIALLFIPCVAFADMGNKPSITVKIKGLRTSNYLVDIFVYDESGENYKSEMTYNNDNLSAQDIELLYSLNYDNWISESTRWGAYLLFADCKGNNLFTNDFSYFGTPKQYRIVIIDKDNNQTKISNIVTRKGYNSEVIIDFDTMDIISTKSVIISSLIVLVLTILIELAVALLFKIKKFSIIILINLITNCLLQVIIYYMNSITIPLFIFLELSVIVLELIGYLLLLKEASREKVILYTLVSNIATALLTFIIL